MYLSLIQSCSEVLSHTKRLKQKQVFQMHLLVVRLHD